MSQHFQSQLYKVWGWKMTHRYGLPLCLVCLARSCPHLGQTSVFAWQRLQLKAKREQIRKQASIRDFSSMSEVNYCQQTECCGWCTLLHAREPVFEYFHVMARQRRVMNVIIYIQVHTWITEPHSGLQLRVWGKIFLQEAWLLDYDCIVFSCSPVLFLPEQL